MYILPDFSLGSLRIGEIAQFLADANNIVIQRNSSKTAGYDKIEQKREQLAQISAALDKALGIDRKSQITQVVAELDSDRDNHFMGIKTICKTFRSYPEAAIANAAAVLFDTIQKYGAVDELSYPDQTAKLRALISEIKNSDALQSAGASVPGISQWLAYLQTSNDQFEQQYLLRVQENAVLPDTAASAWKTPAINAWNELRTIINAYAAIADAKDDHLLTDELAALIQKYREVRAQREGVNANAAKGK